MIDNELESDAGELADDPLQGLDPVARYALEHLGPGTLKGKLNWLKKAHRVLGEEPLVVLVPSQPHAQPDRKQGEPTDAGHEAGEESLLTLLAEVIAADILRTYGKPSVTTGAGEGCQEPSEPAQGQGKAKKKARRGAPSVSGSLGKIDGKQSGSVSSGSDEEEGVDP